MYICLCKAVTAARVKEAIRAGCQTVRMVGGFCAAGKDCGSCRSEIKSIIDIQRNQGKAFAIIDGGAARKAG